MTRASEPNGLSIDVEDALHSEQRFRALLEGATDTVAILDETGKVTYHSPSVTRMLGFEVEELVGGDPFQWIHPDDVDEVRARFADLVGRPGGVETVEYRHAHKEGGWRILESVGRNLLHEPAIEGVVVNTRDITETRELAERLQSAEKMEAVGQLAGGIAHDFNNILTVIQGHAQMLRGHLGEDEDGVEDVREILRSADRAATLTHQLLAFGRRQVVRPQLLDLEKILRDNESMFRSAVGEYVEVVCEVEPDLWPIRADPGHIQQVIVNLLVNARDAMPEGGTVRIVVRGERPDRADPSVVLAVTDDGVGMDSETLDRIYEPFFTTKEHGRGTGLGLASVYGIVQQSGASIDVDSRPGEGTTFEIRFPAAKGAKEVVADPAAGSGGDPPPPPAHEILLIEDDAQIRRLGERILERAGYRVLTAGSGEEAIEIVDARDGSVDLVVSDVVLPGIDGYRTANRLRERYPRLDVLYMSGHMEDQVVRRGVAAAGARFLAKPFAPGDLLEKVAHILEGGDD